MKKYILFVLMFVLCPIQINALMCNNESKVKYSEMARNISVNYEYQETDNDVIFNIKITNIPETFIIVDVKNNITYNYNSSELIIPNVSKNTSYKFNVLKNDDACSWEIFYTHYINIPAYNVYYKDEVCKEIEDYKLCSKWLNVTSSYEEWKNKVVEYKNSLNVSTDEKIKEEEKTIFEVIFDFYLDYYYFILPTIIVLCLVCVYFYNRKNDLF